MYSKTLHSGILSFVLIFNCFAKNNVNIQELVLPSEIKDLGKTSGSVYYSKTNKNKALIPTNFWGEVSKSGLHYIPQGTNLIKGLSLAGGPTGQAQMNKIKVTRTINKNIKTYDFDLEQGGNSHAHQFQLQPGDTVFIEKDRYYEDRNYYTSLISVTATVLSAIILYRQIQTKNPY